MRTEHRLGLHLGENNFSACKFASLFHGPLQATQPLGLCRVVSTPAPSPRAMLSCISGNIEILVWCDQDDHAAPILSALHCCFRSRATFSCISGHIGSWSIDGVFSHKNMITNNNTVWRYGEAPLFSKLKFAHFVQLCQLECRPLHFIPENRTADGAQPSLVPSTRLVHNQEYGQYM